MCVRAPSCVLEGRPVLNHKYNCSSVLLHEHACKSSCQAPLLASSGPLGNGGTQRLPCRSRAVPAGSTRLPKEAGAVTDCSREAAGAARLPATALILTPFFVLCSLLHICSLGGGAPRGR